MSAAAFQMKAVSAAAMPASYADLSVEEYVLLAEQEHWVRQQLPLDAPVKDSQRRRVKRQRKQLREQLSLQQPPENRVRWLDATHEQRDAEGALWFVPSFKEVEHLWPAGTAAPLVPTEEMVCRLMLWCDALMKRWEAYIVRGFAEFGIDIAAVAAAAARGDWRAAGEAAVCKEAARYLTACATGAAREGFAALESKLPARPDLLNVRNTTAVYERMLEAFRDGPRPAAKAADAKAAHAEVRLEDGGEKTPRSMSARSSMSSLSPLLSCMDEDERGGSEDWEYDQDLMDMCASMAKGMSAEPH